MAWLVGVVAVLACGCRIAFDDLPSDAARDGAPDVLLGHDEDGDAVIDDEDFCPHIASTANADTDGDRVGDVCDAEPAVARQQWLLFAPMTAPTIPFANGPTGGWTMNADDWHYIDPPGDTQAQLIRTGMLADVDIWLGLDIETVGGVARQAAIVINGSVPYWYGELFDSGAGARISIIEYDGTSFAARSSMQLGAAFPVGVIDLHLAARPGIGVTVRAAGLTSTYAATGYTGDNLLLLALSNHSGRVRYIAIVTSQ